MPNSTEPSRALPSPVDSSPTQRRPFQTSPAEITQVQTSRAQPTTAQPSQFQHFHTGRSLRSRSFRGVLLALRFRHPTVCPVTLARGASLHDFLGGFFFVVALCASLFPRPLRGRIFRNDSRSRHPGLPHFQARGA